MTKEETIYPTVTQEGLIMSCNIGTMEDLEVATTYIPVYSLQNEKEGMFVVRLNDFI